MKNETFSGRVLSGPDLQSGRESGEHAVENEPSTGKPLSCDAPRSPGRTASPAHSPARLTARGKVLLLAAALAFLFGCGFSQGWLIDLSAAAFVVALLAVPLSYWNLARLRFECDVPEVVHRGEAFDVEGALRNRKGLLPSFDLRLRMSAPGFRGVEFLYPALSCLSTTKDVKPTAMRRRGVFDGFGYSLSSSFPFGLVRREQEGFLSQRLVSSPRPYLPERFYQFLDFGGGDEQYRGGVAHDRQGEFRSMREFRPGDHPKLIAWPVSTRLRKLVVRELEDPRHRHLAIVFHSYGPAGVILSPRTFEKALELVAGLISFLSSRMVAFDVVASFNEWKPLAVTPDVNSEREVLTLLAEARMRPTHSPRELEAAMRGFVAEDRALLVVSNAPSRLWLDLLPASDSPIVYADNRHAGIVEPGSRI